LGRFENGFAKSVIRGMDWIDPAQNRDKWQALVNAVMNPWVS